MGWRGEEGEGGSDTRRAGDVIKSGSGMGEGENEEEPTGNEIIETKMEKIEAFLFYIYIYTRIFWTCLDAFFFKNMSSLLIVWFL